LSVSLDKLNKNIITKVGKLLFDFHKSITKLKQNSVVYLTYWKKITLRKVFSSWKKFIVMKKEKEGDYKYALIERNSILSKKSNFKLIYSNSVFVIKN